MDSSKKRKTCVENQNLSPKEHDINVGNEAEGRKSYTCHQCRHPSETDHVVRCNKCRSTKYCVTCINTWYPNVSEEQFVKACPVCCNTCNCKTCLSSGSHIALGTDDDLNICNQTNGWLSENENDGKDQDSEKKTCDETSGLWQGLKVGMEVKNLLQSVEHHYSDTFENVKFRSERIWLPILKLFHEVITRFIETSVDTLTEDGITSLSEALHDFDTVNFDLSWAHKRLDMVKTLKFGKDPLQQEKTDLVESLQLVNERLVERRNEYDAAYKKLMETQLEYNEMAHAENDKEQRMKERFGDDYDVVLYSRLGFGMLSEYEVG